MSVDAKPGTPRAAARCPETVSAVQSFLRGGYRARTAAALGAGGAVITVFTERSSTLQNNFSLVTNMCAVFSHRITLASWAKTSAVNVRAVVFGPREA